jgi:predicted RND superfamily exporter protein
MHLLTEVDGYEEASSLELAVREVSRPIALSGLTTAVSFASTAIMPIEAVQRVGVLGAAGALIATAATTGLGAAIVAKWRTRRRANPLLGLLRTFASETLVTRIQRHSGLVVLAWATALAVGISAANRLQVESDVIVWFPEGNEVRDDYEAIKERLSGISPLNVIVRAEDGAKVTEPEVLRAIDDLSRYLSSLPDVGKVLSITDSLRLVRAGFGDEIEDDLPRSQAAAEQYLLLLEGTERLGDVITRDRSAANVMLRVNDNGSRNLLDVASKAEAWWGENGPTGTEAKATGSMFEYARAEEAISSGQIQGLALDVAIIGAVLFVALRSLRLATLALIPNVLPIGLMFGFMGASGIPLDMGTVFVSNLAVGIAIDETIHLISAYARTTRRGVDPQKSLQSAMMRVVPALVLTTVVIAFGFLVLSVSEFRFTRNLGLLTAGVMVLCVASNATLLPALLVRWGTRR